MTVAIISPFSILVTWNPPLTPNGVLTQYTIYFDETPVLSVDGGTTSSVVEGLSANTEYGVRVSASTKVGEGLLSAVVLFATPESSKV